MFQPHTHTHNFIYIYLSEYFNSSWAKVYILFVLLAEDLSSLWSLLWQPFTLPAFDMTLCSRSPTQHLPYLITFVYLVVLPLHQMELQENWYFLVKFFIIYMLVPCWSKYSSLQFQTVEDHEFGWWMWTLYNYIGNKWKIGKWNILNKQINPQGVKRCLSAPNRNRTSKESRSVKPILYLNWRDN